MTKEEARGYLMDITTKIDTADIDAFEMREAINTLYFDDDKDNTTTKIRIKYYTDKGFAASTICGNCNSIANGNFCSHCGKRFAETITKDLGKISCKDCAWTMNDDNETICMCAGKPLANNDGCLLFHPKEIK